MDSISKLTPPHTYPKGYPEGIVKEYARRYRVLYRIKHGAPLLPKTKLDSYFRLKLLERQGDALRVTALAEELYFTPTVFEDSDTTTDGFPF
jgi:hypothetical protein